jgi:hypothetical protein
MSEQEPNKPVADFRVGGTVTASVWENTVQQGENTVVRRSVQLQKRYYDKADQTWKTSKSFYANHIPRAVLALQKAYEWIMMQPRDAAVEEAAESEEVPI